MEEGGEGGKEGGAEGEGEGGRRRGRRGYGMRKGEKGKSKKEAGGMEGERIGEWEERGIGGRIEAGE